MLKVALLSRYSGEIELLKARLDYLNIIQRKFIDKIHLSQHLVYSDKYWNLKTINPDPSKQIGDEISDIFLKENCSHINLENLSPRDNEDLTLTALEKKSIHLSKSHDWLIVSDLDEFVSKDLFQNLLKKKIPQNCITYCKQISMYYNSNYLYDEQWLGPLVFHSSFKKSSIALAMNSRHLKYERFSTISDGIHLSYFKSTLNMKRSSTHALPRYRLRKFLSSIGIHPFLRSPSICNHPIDKDILNSISNISFTHYVINYRLRNLIFNILRLINYFKFKNT